MVYQKKTESVQYDATLALTGTNRGNSKRDLGPETLKDRR